MQKKDVVAIAIAVLLVVVAVEGAVLVEKESTTLKPGWLLLGPSDPTSSLTLTFALKMQNAKQMETLFWQVSDPTHPKYGQYLSFEDFKKQFAPSDADLTTITTWLEANKATQVTVHPSNEFVTATLTVADAEMLLSTKYKQFIHIGTGKIFTKAVGEYFLPDHIAPIVTFVSGFRLPNWKSRQHSEPRATAVSLDGDNYPIQVYVNPLDRLTSNVVLPRCYNGTVTTVWPLCAEYGTPIMNITVTPIVDKKFRYENTVSINTTPDRCTACSNATGHVLASCSAANAMYNLSMSTIYCEIPVPALPNYTPVSFAYQTIYSNYYYSSQGSNNYTFYLSPFTTPQSLKRLYNIPQNLVANNTANSQSVAEFLGQYYSPYDLNLFFQAFALANSSNLVSLIGPNQSWQPGGEASLDIQYIMGIAGNVSTVFWSVPGLNNGQEPFLQWITDVLNTATPPLVHSVSYGDDESSLSYNYMTALNSQFMKAGMRGLTLLFASGDNGVFSGNPVDPNLGCGNTFTPSFPPSSPYVTSVGATMLSMRNSPICSYTNSLYYPEPLPCEAFGEIVSSTSVGSRITSGGGFSNYFPTPAYQTKFVQQYLSGSFLPPFFNPSGRAYPDISAIGHNYLVFINGAVDPVDGTSASTPVVGGMMTLLNDIRLNIGLPSLGFVNPLLYYLAGNTEPSPFNDVFIGDNSCSELYWVCCPAGFSAAVGYDPVSGLGTPNFGALYQLVQQFALKPKISEPQEPVLAQ